jgi:hypothetical protein
MFSLADTSLAYAKVAEKILGDKSAFLDENPEVLPILVEILFRSLEASLKHVGIESCLFSKEEARSRKLTDNGHGISKIARLINSRLGSTNDYPVITALLAGTNDQRYFQIIQILLFGPGFEPTRRAYSKRSLGYLQLEKGDLQLISDLEIWVKAVRAVSDNLTISIDVITQWSNSTSNSDVFALWYS